MSSYFYDDKGNIRLELVEKEAVKNAEDFCRRGLSSSQLRKFFTEVKAFEKRLREIDTNEYFQKTLPLIKMLKAKVSYASSATSSRDKVPREFVNFVCEKIDKIQNKEDFKAFVLHFESVVGYFYSFSR